MLTLIHGDDIVSSRKYFQDIKQRHVDALLIEGDKANLTDITQIFEGGGLFYESKTVFIEQFLTKKFKKSAAGSAKKTASEAVNIAAYLEKQATDNNIILWEGKELEKSALSLFKIADIKMFKFPQTLFLFLDSIKPNNGKQLISLFHKTIVNSEEEMVFFMLIRQVRLFLGIVEPTPDPIDEIKRVQPWQKDKLKKQAALFKKEQLIQLYSDLFKIETGQKTGGLSSSLTSSIDFLLLGI